MAEGTLTETIRKIVAKAEPYVPQVPKPKKKISLQSKLMWTTGCLVIYLVMGQTPLFGATAPEFDFFLCRVTSPFDYNIISVIYISTT